MSTVSLDSFCRCDTCALTFKVVGEVNSDLYEEFSQLLSCPKCSGRMWWEKGFRGFAYRVKPEHFYRLVKGVETLDGRPDPDVVAAMLTTFRVQQVLMDGHGIRALYLESGSVLHLGISQKGAYVHKITREDQS